MEDSNLPQTVPTVVPSVIEAMSMEDAQKAFRNLQQFVKSQMRQGVDYGIIPGCKKPSLWKSGAERLLFFHGLGCKLDTTSETIVDWKAPFFNYCYRATVYNPRTGAVIATSDGSCNSKEEKYRYQWMPEWKVPKGVDKASLETRERDGKKSYRVENPDIFSLVNTIQKMASKRAMVAATLIACRASDAFTQDEVEEDDHSGEPTQKVQQQPPQQSSQHSQQTQQEPEQQESAPSGDVISDKQRKRLFAISKSAGVEQSTVSAFLRQNYPYTLDDEGLAHTSKIRRADYEKICGHFEKGGG